MFQTAPVEGGLFGCQQNMVFIVVLGGSCTAGLWSKRAARLAVQWADHIQRDRRLVSHWPAQFSGWHATSWCQEWRRMAGILALAAGRMDSRPASAYLALRWHDAVAAARTML